VFIVGIALSAGAAARFTRPARRLDAALRELSDGDLDTEVEVRGSDEIARLGIAFNDMTRKMRANRERAREMIRRDKLSALGRLAAGVAHDVRNPLHSIGLTLTNLTDTGRPVDPERRAEFDRSVSMIRGEIRRLDQLVVNFLRFANGEHRRREKVDLRALVEETATLVKKETEWRGIDLVLDLENVPEVEVDVEAIRSSLLNLVLNSCEAMPEGGRLDLVLRDAGAEVVLEVGDTGRGIPQDRREKVFDFGYSTREGGSGLGLVMVHQCVVEDHGGRVTLESEENQGTRVRLALPVGNGTEES
jgi:signal transduction histidine kinase